MINTFTVHKESIHGAIGRVVGAVDKRSTIPILAFILVEVGVDQTVKLTATDLGLRAVAKFPAEVTGQAGSICAPAEPLRAIIGAASGKITITMINNNLLEITTDSRRWELPCLPAAEFPAYDCQWVADGFAFTPGTLPGLINAVQHAVSTDDTRYNQCGINLAVDAERLTAAATDDHRCSVAAIQLDSLSDFADVLIHNRGARQLANLTGSIEQHRSEDGSNNQVYFQTAGGITAYAIQLIESAFPDYRRVIPVDHPGCVTIDADQLITAVESCGILAEGNSRAVNLKVEGEILTISAHSIVGRAIATVPCSVNNTGIRDLDISINSRYLLQALKSLDGEINIKHGTDSQPIIILPTDLGMFDERLELLLPIRI
jgi:DNA polymerase-3 subunit beta